jgi:hypothetical protein
MSEIVPAPPAPATSAPEPNSAIDRCYQAYRQAAKTAREQGKYDLEIRSAAKEAYRNAMPPLSGVENIRNFIACIAEGMLNESIGSADGMRHNAKMQCQISPRSDLSGMSPVRKKI